jgi:hypothetical protein
MERNWSSSNWTCSVDFTNRKIFLRLMRSGTTASFDGDIEFVVARIGEAQEYAALIVERNDRRSIGRGEHPAPRQSNEIERTSKRALPDEFILYHRIADRVGIGFLHADTNGLPFGDWAVEIALHHDGVGVCGRGIIP